MVTRNGGRVVVIVEVLGTRNKMEYFKLLPAAPEFAIEMAVRRQPGLEPGRCVEDEAIA